MLNISLWLYYNVFWWRYLLCLLASYFCIKNKGWNLKYVFCMRKIYYFSFIVTTVLGVYLLQKYWDWNHWNKQGFHRSLLFQLFPTILSLPTYSSFFDKNHYFFGSWWKKERYTCFNVVTSVSSQVYQTVGRVLILRQGAICILKSKWQMSSMRRNEPVFGWLNIFFNWLD